MIKIKAVERQVGFGKDEKKKRWFPAIYLSSDVTFEEFIDKVADETTISSADVKAVFDLPVRYSLSNCAKEKALIVAT
ncbi:hypothetical protein [Porphyromonas endodontalis]|uniref:HU family DNA-binding protein n=1 Tax=Porphyromonas endodontalis TaxID=28124 RepID=UPI00288BCD21|nr:hypothetical protein [Porphyromonas endodontalis]